MRRWQQARKPLRWRAATQTWRALLLLGALGISGVLAPRGASAKVPIIVEFGAKPQTVAPGELVMLHWSAKHAKTCFVVGVGNTLGADASVEVSPQQSKTYTLICKNRRGEAKRDIDVAVMGSLGDAPLRLFDKQPPPETAVETPAQDSPRPDEPAPPPQTSSPPPVPQKSVGVATPVVQRGRTVAQLDAITYGLLGTGGAILLAVASTTFWVLSEETQTRVVRQSAIAAATTGARQDAALRRRNALEARRHEQHSAALVLAGGAVLATGVAAYFLGFADDAPARIWLGQDSSAGLSLAGRF